MSNYVFELSDISIANGSDTLQINNSDSVFGAIPGSMLWIDSYRPRFVQSVDNTARTVTLTANWDGADVVNKPATIAPFPAFSAHQAAVDAMTTLTGSATTLISEYQSFPGEQIQSDLQAVQQQITKEWVTPEMLGFDISTQFTEFVQAVSAAGVQGRGEAGKTYLISQPAEFIASKDVHLDFSRSKLLQAGDNPLIAITNTADIVAVTAIANESRNLGNGNVLTKVTKFTAPGHTFVAGDTLKVFSDDVVPFTDGPGQYCGEWLIVGAVDGDDIFATGEVYETYTTNIKLAKPARHVVDIKLHAESTILDSINDSLVTIQGFIKPTLILTARNANATCINVTSCYKALVKDCNGNYAKNRPDLASYGYFINDSASYMTRVSGMRSEYARHAYTTTTPNAALDDDKWYLRGRTMFSKVTESFGQGCANAFDTHAQAVGIEMIDCTSVSDYRGYDTGGAGFQIRGQRCKVRGKSINSKYGAAVSGAYATETQHVEIDIEHEGPEGHIPVIINGSATHKSIVELTVRGEVSSSAAVVGSHTTIKAKTFLSVAQAVNGSKIFDLGEQCFIHWLSGELDYDNSTGNTLILAEHTHADSGIKCETPIVINNGDGKLLYAADLNTYDSQSVYFLSTDFALNGTPFLAAENASNASVFYSKDFFQRPLGYRAISYGAAGDRDVDLSYSADPIITCRFTVTAAGVAVNTITKGAFWGQMLILCNRDASSHNLTINNNSGGLIRIGATRNLTPSGSLILFWDGSVWRLASNNTPLTAFAIYNPAELAPGAHDVTTISMPGISLGMPVQVAFEADLQGIDLTAYVSATDTVTVKFHNNTASTTNLDSSTIRIKAEL